MVWRTRSADAWHSCHVFPLFFPSTIKHFGLFVLSSSFACYDSENIALIFHPLPLFFSPPSSYLFLFYPFILRCLPMLRSFIEFISIYVPRCKVAMIKTGSRRAMKYEYVKDFICQPVRWDVREWLYGFIINIFLLLFLVWGSCLGRDKNKRNRMDRGRFYLNRIKVSSLVKKNYSIKFLIDIVFVSRKVMSLLSSFESSHWSLRIPVYFSYE